jgi:uncharacterized membrane protein YtjA (UPF0391 family)
MFRWGIIFLVIALIAAALGFGGLAGTAAGAAKIVFVVGIILFLVSLFTDVAVHSDAYSDSDTEASPCDWLFLI